MNEFICNTLDRMIGEKDPSKIEFVINPMTKDIENIPDSYKGIPIIEYPAAPYGIIYLRDRPRV